MVRKPLRVGVLGFGRMGKLHLMNAMRIKDVKVVACADKTKHNLEAARKFHINVYDDYRKLIDTEDLDAVIISLPNFLKKESIIYASEKNLNIVVDKPLARNYEEAVEIVKKVEKERVKLMVAVNYRYFDCVQRLKGALDEGKVGDVPIATCELITDQLGHSHPLVPGQIPDWWFKKELAGGGAVLDLGYHLIDLFNWMFGDIDVLYTALEYRSNLPLEDSATMVLRSRKTSTRAVINVGWFSRMIFPNFDFRVNLHGSAGYLTTDDFVPKNPYLHAAKEGTANLLRKITFRKINYLTYAYYYSSFPTILKLFFDALKHDSPVPVSLEQQLETMKIIGRIYSNS